VFVHVAWNPQKFLHLKRDKYIFGYRERENENAKCKKCKQREQTQCRGEYGSQEERKLRNGRDEIFNKRNEVM